MIKENRLGWTHNVRHVLPSSKSTFPITNGHFPMLKGADTSQICLNYQLAVLPQEGGGRGGCASFIHICRFLNSDPSVKHPKTDSMNPVLSRPQPPQQAPCPHLNALVESRFCLPKADYGRALFHSPVSHRVLSHSRLFLITQVHVIRHMHNNLSEICSKLF